MNEWSLFNYSSASLNRTIIFFDYFSHTVSTQAGILSVHFYPCSKQLQMIKTVFITLLINILMKIKFYQISLQTKKAVFKTLNIRCDSIVEILELKNVNTLYISNIM